MKNWREIRRARKVERKYLVEQAKLDAWLDEDFPKYRAERAALYAALLRVLDARFCQLVQAAWEDNALWAFRQDLARVLRARVDQLEEDEALFQHKLRRWAGLNFGGRP